MTVNEFLKEFEMTQKKYLNKRKLKFRKIKYLIFFRNENLNFEETPYLALPGQQSTTSTASTTPLSILSPNSNVYEKILPQSTPLKNQTGEPQPKAVSRSKKLGQILKLASVRGAKSKSMKHKYSTQIHQHAFIHKNINNDTTCDICHKTLLNKKPCFVKVSLVI